MRFLFQICFKFLLTAGKFRCKLIVRKSHKLKRKFHKKIIIKEIKAREDKARKQLAKQGYSLKKSRSKTYTVNDCGGYMIVQDGIIQAGERFNMTLEEVEKFIGE